MRARGWGLAAALVACGGSGSGGDASLGSGGGAPFGQSVSGVATYYAADGSGACSFDASPSDLDVAAMDAAQYDHAAVCGECARVTGPKGNVTVRIVDLCPDCESGHLDLSEESFAKIADTSAGRVPITWQTVACSVSGNVSYHYKDGSNAWWAAIQVRNQKLPIGKLEVQTSGAYTALTREDYNYYMATNLGTGSVKVRITSVDGQTLEDTLPAPTSDATVNGSGQFR